MNNAVARLALSASLAVLPVAPSFGQAAAAPGSTGSARAERPSKKAPGPNLFATKRWIESEMAVLTENSHVETPAHSPNHLISTTSVAAREFSFDGCVLRFALDIVISSTSDKGPGHDSTRVLYAAPLDAVDLNGVTVMENATAPERGATPAATLMVQMAKRGSSDKFFITEMGSIRDDSATNVRLPVSDKQSGERVVKALKRAAELCGASAGTF